jgi:hypothetical protein
LNETSKLEHRVREAADVLMAAEPGLTRQAAKRRVRQWVAFRMTMEQVNESFLKFGRAYAASVAADGSRGARRRRRSRA